MHCVRSFPLSFRWHSTISRWFYCMNAVTRWTPMPTNSSPAGFSVFYPIIHTLISFNYSIRNLLRHEYFHIRCEYCSYSLRFYWWICCCEPQSHSIRSERNVRCTHLLSLLIGRCSCIDLVMVIAAPFDGEVKIIVAIPSNAYRIRYSIGFKSRCNNVNYSVTVWQFGDNQKIANHCHSLLMRFSLDHSILCLATINR